MKWGREGRMWGRGVGETVVQGREVEFGASGK